MRANPFQDLLQQCRTLGVGATDQDAEAVPAQMTGFQFVGVPACVQQSDAVALKFGQPRFGRFRHRDPLARHRVAIFQAGRPDLAGQYAEPLADLTDEILGAHRPLFDP